MKRNLVPSPVPRHMGALTPTPGRLGVLDVVPSDCTDETPAPGPEADPEPETTAPDPDAETDPDATTPDPDA